MMEFHIIYAAEHAIGFRITLALAILIIGTITKKSITIGIVVVTIAILMIGKGAITIGDVMIDRVNLMEIVVITIRNKIGIEIVLITSAMIFHGDLMDEIASPIHHKLIQRPHGIGIEMRRILVEYRMIIRANLIDPSAIQILIYRHLVHRQSKIVLIDRAMTIHVELMDKIVSKIHHKCIHRQSKISAVLIDRLTIIRDKQIKRIAT